MDDTEQAEFLADLYRLQAGLCSCGRALIQDFEDFNIRMLSDDDGPYALRCENCKEDDEHG